MKKLIYWTSVLANMGILGFVIFMLLKKGAPRGDEIGLVVLLILAPLLSLALAYTFRIPAENKGESWIELELAARKAKLKKIIAENEGAKAR